MRMLAIQKYALMTVFLLAALLMAGCNTMEGVGKDLQSAGQAIEDTF